MYLLLLLLLPFSLFAIESKQETTFQGTLLSIPATNTKPGHFFIEPYLFITNRYGIYTRDSHIFKQESMQYTNLTVVQGGLNDYLDVSLILTSAYTQFASKSSFHYGDTGLYFGIPLLEQTKKTFYPSIRLILGESFPTGDYHELDPTIFEIDGLGSGAFETTLILSLAKTLHRWNVTFNFISVLSSSLHVLGKSIYGGTPGTNGIISPGFQYIINLALERCITPKLILGLDVRWEHQNTCHFRSLHPFTPLAGSPSSDRFSLAPCFEYTFTENIGMDTGLWFSVTGRNSIAFVSSVTAVYFYF